MNISQYLVTRLEELGLKHMFGVPGDYSMPFLDVVLESSIAWVGNCNELNAGYAADGYAQVSGLGALSVTYDVGGFSAYNAIAGSYVERVPVVVISGAPPLSKQSTELMHHLVASYDHQRDIYSKVTVAAEVLRDPARVPEQVDRALKACLEHHRPVYFEIPMDLTHAPCAAPSGKLVIERPKSDPTKLQEAVQQAVELLKTAQRPAVLAGCDVDRLGLHAALLKLLERAGYPAAVTIDALTAVPMAHPQRAGLYAGALSDERVRHVVEEADRLLCVGTRRTDITSGVFSARIEPERLIRALGSGVSFRRDDPLAGVELKDFLEALAEALPAGKAQTQPGPAPWPKPTAGRLTSDGLFARLDALVDANTTVLADTGDALFQTTRLTRVGRLMNQGFYLSIGYALPAGIGAALAAPRKRTLVVIGDGAFQMTAQELSTMVGRKIPMGVVLVNNDGYVVERLLHSEAAYNDINRWRYADLPRVFGDCATFRVDTMEELEQALAALERGDGPVFIEAVLARNECGELLRRQCSMAV